MPASVATIHREHVEPFIEDAPARYKPRSAANRLKPLVVQL